MALLSIRGYARHRNCSPAAVRRALKTNRISTTPDGRIDPNVADREWRENTQPRPPATHGAPDKGYTRARVVREMYEARLAQLEYEERTGKLVDRAKLERDTFNLFRGHRDRLLGIPDRIAATVAAEADSLVIRNMLVIEMLWAMGQADDSVRDCGVG
jgi:superfamily I DNA/RNA helicase